MRILLYLLFILISFNSVAQEVEIDSLKKKKAASLKPLKKEIEANFLSSYYQQDGDNAAVTGGIGTEKLTDVANVFTLNIPLDSTKSINLYTGADYYSSASTDAIDRNPSSASSSDTRAFATVTYSKLNLKRDEIYALKLGTSVEYDYTSVMGGFSYTKLWNEANSELQLSGQAFIDNWQLIYPSELRRTVSLSNSRRQSFNGQIIYSQVLNKRMQMSLSAEVIYMTGLLSTPFHRVYFADTNSPDIERLPDTRVKIPLSIRFNVFPIDNLVIRSYYRYYWDDFGIQGNTFELETPIKVGTVFTFSPFYRYHTQTAADYFAPYQTHLSNEQFYTPDYDLSALSSHKVGMGIKYHPLYGLFRSKHMFKNKRVLMIKYLSLRGAYYQRSTGLNSFIGSLNIGFSLK